MTFRSRITFGLLLTAILAAVAILIAWVTLIAVDSTRVVDDHPGIPQPNTILHAVIVTTLATATIVLITVGGVLYVRCVIVSVHDRAERRFDSLDRRLDVFTDDLADIRARLDDITGEIPKVQTVVVRRDSRNGEDGLDAYARGYVAGLAREPMAESNVVPINGHGS